MLRIWLDDNFHLKECRQRRRRRKVWMATRLPNKRQTKRSMAQLSVPSPKSRRFVSRRRIAMMIPIALFSGAVFLFFMPFNSWGESPVSLDLSRRIHEIEVVAEFPHDPDAFTQVCWVLVISSHFRLSASLNVWNSRFTGFRGFSMRETTHCTSRLVYTNRWLENAVLLSLVNNLFASLRIIAMGCSSLIFVFCFLVVLSNSRPWGKWLYEQERCGFILWFWRNMCI